LTVAMRDCNLVSNNAELIGISTVWNGFFMTASESDHQLIIPSVAQEKGARSSETFGREDGDLHISYIFLVRSSNPG
jgi:hypothetical protein